MSKTRTTPKPRPDVEATITRLIPHHLPAIETFWLSALRTCFANPDMLAAFREATGMTWTPARTPIDRLIDEATGHESAYLVAFIEWFHTHVWGDDTPHPLRQGEGLNPDPEER